MLNNLTLPSVGAPVFLVGGVAQPEGLIPLGSNLSVTGSSTIYFTTDGSDPRLEGGTINLTASSVSSGGVIPLSVGTHLKARVRNGTNWSALSEGTFFVGPIATSANIVISELMYHPVGQDEGAEYLELMNVDPVNSIDLSMTTFAGIDYTFPLGESLAAGERIVIVKDPVAFAAAYSTAGIRFAPGAYSASLNNDGEEIALINALGSDAQRFTYNDVSPWPVSADGLGYSLTLIAPEASPDHSLPENWRSSALPGGSPGTSDSEVFAGNPAADLDHDGLSAFLEYALGSLAGEAGFSPESFVVVGSGFFDDGLGVLKEFPSYSYRRNLRADDVLVIVEVSANLAAWNDAGTVFVSSVANGDGTETVTVRGASPTSDEVRQFVRLRVSSRP